MQLAYLNLELIVTTKNKILSQEILRHTEDMLTLINKQLWNAFHSCVQVEVEYCHFILGIPTCHSFEKTADTVSSKNKSMYIQSPKLNI